MNDTHRLRNATSGDIHELIDMAGDPRGVAGGLEDLANTTLEDRPVNMLMRDAATGETRVAMLADIVKATAAAEVAA